MKRIIKTAAYVILAVAAAGCAKQVAEGPNKANQMFFESWMKLNHPDAKPSGLGIYIIEEEEGKGLMVQKDGFVYADYVITDLEGNISDYTDKNTAKQLGTYDTSYYYGPKVITTIAQTIPAGVADALIGMREGGRKKVIIPGWLMSYASYKTEEDYLAQSSSAGNMIYDITVREYTDSVNVHEIDLIERYMSQNAHIFSDPQKDTIGFYYQTLRKGTDSKALPSDTTIYINYTGKLLNGQIFDTTDEKVAKDNGIYSSSRTYKPVSVTMAEEISDIKMSGSSIISGFAMTIAHMHPMEKGLGIFYSPYGYSYNGSGKSIPGYAPLIFEIELVEKP